MIHGFVILAILARCIAVEETTTGYDFPLRSDKGALQKLGVHKKGEEPEYAIGIYWSFWGSPQVLIKMNMNESVEEFTAPLTDALKSRAFDQESVARFRDLMLRSLPDGCKKGQQFEIQTADEKLRVTIDGHISGDIESRSLANAFIAIHTDHNAISTLYEVGETDVDDPTHSDHPAGLKAAAANPEVGGGQRFLPKLRAWSHMPIFVVPV